MFAAVAAWFRPAAEDKLKGSTRSQIRWESHTHDIFLTAHELDLLSLGGVQGASHLKVGTPDRFHNVIKIPARAPPDPPLPPLVSVSNRHCIIN